MISVPISIIVYGGALHAIHAMRRINKRRERELTIAMLVVNERAKRRRAERRKRIEEELKKKGVWNDDEQGGRE